jgi:hypothetical protein
MTINSSGQLGSTSGGGGSVTINGDTGSASGATLNLNAANIAGPTASFNASGTTIAFTVSDGSSNIILGTNTNTGGSQNVAVGDGIFSFGAPGNDNVVMGFNAFRRGGGSNNVAIGAATLENTSFQGSNNTVLGFAAGAAFTSTETNNIIIGYNSSGLGNLGDNNVTRIGDPTSVTSCFIGGIAGVTVSSSAAVLINTSTGQLGTVVSSRRYKENISDMDDASRPIMDLRPVTFNLKNDRTHERRFGLIAEEVEEIIPDLVVRNKEGDPETVKYHDLPVLLLNELQRQHNIIAELSRRLDRLEGRAKYESKN